MFGIVTGALIGMVTRLMTSEFIQFCILKALDVVVSKTDTKVDDEFVAEIHRILNK